MVDDMMQRFGQTAGRLTPQIMPTDSLPLNLADSQDLFASNDATGPLMTTNGQSYGQWSPSSDYHFSTNFGENDFPAGTVNAQGGIGAFEEWDSIMLEEDAGHSLQVTSCGHVKYMGNSTFHPPLIFFMLMSGF